MKIIQKIYTFWCLIWLLTSFLLCYPLMFLGALFSKLHVLTHFMNKVWGVLFFTGAGLFYKKIGNSKFDSPVVYCANHTSYLDIPLLFLTIPGFFMIIGKAELRKVPLFGFVFSRVYITVDRKNPKDAFASYQKCLQSLETGRSVVFFPEGTIPKGIAPKLGKFKDGSFRLAIEKKVPLIPITMPFNWVIFPDYGQRLVSLKRPIAIFSEPIVTQELRENDFIDLRDETMAIIQRNLEKFNPQSFENRT